LVYFSSPADALFEDEFCYTEEANFMKEHDKPGCQPGATLCSPTFAALVPKGTISLRPKIHLFDKTQD
jgi:hypothetical protein